MSANGLAGPPVINYATHPRRAQRAGDGSDARLESQVGPPVINYSTCPARAQHAGDDTPRHGGTRTTRSESLMDGLAQNLQDLQMAGSPQPQPASVAMSVSPLSAYRCTKKKYYSVVVGRCCGVFASWLTVKTLIDRVPGGLATGFRTYDEAVEDYNDAKARGFVRLEREPGDDLVFSPRSQGVM